jgi:hypothetical protein
VKKALHESPRLSVNLGAWRAACGRTPAGGVGFLRLLEGPRDGGWAPPPAPPKKWRSWHTRCRWWVAAGRPGAPDALGGPVARLFEFDRLVGLGRSPVEEASHKRSAMGGAPGSPRTGGSSSGSSGFIEDSWRGDMRMVRPGAGPPVGRRQQVSKEEALERQNAGREGREGGPGGNREGRKEEFEGRWARPPSRWSRPTQGGSYTRVHTDALAVLMGAPWTGSWRGVAGPGGWWGSMVQVCCVCVGGGGSGRLCRSDSQTPY